MSPMIGDVEFRQMYPEDKVGGKKDVTKWVLNKLGDKTFKDLFPLDEDGLPLTDSLKFEEATFEFQRLHAGDFGKTGVFVGTIVGVMLAPMPLGAVALFGLMLGMITNSISFKEAMSGFSGLVPWLIIVAYALAIPFVETGLGRRISLLVVKVLGKSTIGLAYALGLVDTFMAIGIPSISARAGGVTLPIARELCKVAGSEPNDETGPDFGYFLHLTLFQMGVVNSAVFSTAVASNPIATEAAKSSISQSVHITFGTWFIAAVVPCLLLLACIPVITYVLCKPSMKKFPDAAGFANRGLAELGPLSKDEKWVILAFGVAISLWIAEGIMDIAGIDGYKLNSVGSGLVGLCILLVHSSFFLKKHYLGAKFVKK